MDGAYEALISRIRDGSVPTLILMKRNEHWGVEALTAIHHLFLTPDVVEKRNPFSPLARRAGEQPSAWMPWNYRDTLARTAQV